MLSLSAQSSAVTQLENHQQSAAGIKYLLNCVFNGGCTKEHTVWNTSYEYVWATKNAIQELSVSISTGKERNAEISLNSKSFVPTEEGY